jgi:hypothetical protein
MILDALTYPIRGTGWVMILVGAVFAVLLDLAQVIPFLGLVALLFSAGYFGAFYLDIVASTMAGEDTTPDWPTGFWDEVLIPLGRLIGLTLLSFGPALLLLIFAQREAPWFAGAFLAALAYGCVYFPMSVLAAQALGGVGGALPHVVIPAVFRALPSYLWALLALGLILILGHLAQDFVVQVPFIGWFLSAAVGLYGMVFQGRIIGLVYVRRREQLGWG